MAAFELILIVLGCVIVSAVLNEVVPRMSLPLIQIVVGFLVALVVPAAAHVEVDPELFLVLFIAPLLFHEARHVDKRQLWEHKGAILSLAIGLVIALVLAIGFTLHWLVPSIPLAAAFACGAALGPTDAAAVAALGSTVRLSERQETLLSGESLINDASGVVSFQFAIAAAVTGAFSIAEAGASFVVLFFGGILAGIVMGGLARLGIMLVRRRGFESTTVHVIYEVFTPFVVFLAAEEIGVSGILAVVAAGIVMSRGHAALATTSAVRHAIVSNSVWEVIVFLINGAIFTMLGMQLTQVVGPVSRIQGFTAPQLLGLVLVLTLVLVAVRFVWVGAMDLLHRDAETGLRGIANVADTLRDALVTTIAGPKGAVTLSIIFTIPYALADGTAFPQRGLIVFLTAGVILCTLLLADATLPLLARKPEVSKSDEQAKLRAASIELYERVIAELRAKVSQGTRPEYTPATRLTIARYRTRLNRERFLCGEEGKTLELLAQEVLDVQQRKADEIQSAGAANYTTLDAAPYYIALRGIRDSVGYVGKARSVGSRFHTLRGRLAMLLRRLMGKGEVGGAESEEVYRQTCLFAIDLENAAIDYLKCVREEGDEARAKAARVLIGEHRAALVSIRGRLDYNTSCSDLDETGTPVESAPTDADAMASGREAVERVETPSFSEQFAIAWRHANEVDAAALEVELDQIRKMHQEGRIDEAIARKLREDVYLLQMGLGE